METIFIDEDSQRPPFLIEGRTAFAFPYYVQQLEALTVIKRLTSGDGSLQAVLDVLAKG